MKTARARPPQPLAQRRQSRQTEQAGFVGYHAFEPRSDRR
jgi:hypothetical protein